MTRLVIDAMALLRFIDGETGSERVESILNRARLQAVELLMSAVNWGEIVYSVLKAHGPDQDGKLLPKLRSMPIVIMDVNAEDAAMAATFNKAYKIPYADSFAGSLAISEPAALLTADHDFKFLPSNVLKVDVLPAKPKH